MDGHPDLQVYTAKGFAESVRKEIDESFIPIILILVIAIGGFVTGEKMQKRAIEIAKGTKGVKSVVDAMYVKPAG